MYYVKMIADSVSPSGNRISTLECKYPRFIHSQVLTHRMFSRNAASSRAIPVTKMLKEVSENPVFPFSWGANEPGMVAQHNIAAEDVPQATQIWSHAVDNAFSSANALMKLGVHKQVVNRLLEPFCTMTIILTATEFDGWDEQRLGESAQPEIQWLAREIREIRDASIPVQLEDGDWHMPYITDYERATVRDEEVLKRISVARCARVSYNNHNGVRNVGDDIRLYQKLVDGRHPSPFEHVASPGGDCFYANFWGWKSYRFRIMPDSVQRKSRTNGNYRENDIRVA